MKQIQENNVPNSVDPKKFSNIHLKTDSSYYDSIQEDIIVKIS